MPWFQYCPVPCCQSSSHLDSFYSKSIKHVDVETVECGFVIAAANDCAVRLSNQCMKRGNVRNGKGTCTARIGRTNIKQTICQLL